MEIRHEKQVDMFDKSDELQNITPSESSIPRGEKYDVDNTCEDVYRIRSIRRAIVRSNGKWD